MNEPHVATTRVFPVPRAVLFRAFMDADILARWWGPEGFTNTFTAFDPRPGQVWRFAMHGPDGAAYEMANEFIAVLPDEHIILQHHQPGHDFRLEMTYVDEAAGTRLTWRMWFDSPAEAERLQPYLAAANEQNFDRLARQLASISPL